MAAFLVAAILVGFVPGFVPASVAQADPVEEIFSRLSAADRVGQLFLVTFFGNDVGPSSDIAQLIRDYRVGGVVLLPRNGNFQNDGTAPQQVAELARDLQIFASERSKSSPQSTPQTGGPTLAAGRGVPGAMSPSRPPAIPLFIAVYQEGDGYPFTAIRDGLTPVPSNMAIGATWNISDASKVGEVVGREMRALGVNMLLGPSLDVLNTPRPALKGDLGVRTFGGDPFWVGRLGQAYIRGVHKGGGGRVITVAKHFPGLGAADRRPDEEVPTVPKSLAELRNLELVPFFAVTGNPGDDGATDALLSEHIRYRGFQGNIRQLTRPISLDPQNLQMLLSEPGLVKWRQNGGLIVSDALGVPALRRYYDPQLKTFPYKRIAQDALLAGNDLLLLHRFGLTDSPAEQMENIKSTIEFFQEKYRSDSNFQDRVDQSVRRILRAKYRMYGTLEHPDVGEATDLTGVLNKGRPEIMDVAKHAVTLIYPAIDELVERLPAPPSTTENVLIVTDTREYRECEACQPQPIIPVDALEKAIVRLYGPKGSGQIDPARLHSTTFAQLKRLLSSPDTKPLDTDLDALINHAEWIIFCMTDVNTEEAPSADTVKAFLKMRSDSLRGKKIIVFAFGAPYYLDTTEISKLTAYYGLYTKVEPFIEAAARALFQEFSPVGALPVSVDGVNYDLITQTAPDPKQVIQIQLANDANSQPRQTLDVTVGSTLHLRTSVIVDRNGHQVPDGTPVSFRLIYLSEAVELPRKEVTTVDGVAETMVTLERSGQLQITAISEPAIQSTPLIVTVQGDRSALSIPQPLTGVLSTSISPTTVVSAAQTAEPLAVISATATSRVAEEHVLLIPRVKEIDLWLCLAGIISLNLVIDLFKWRRGWTRVSRLRLWLMGIICGLAGYLVYALGALNTDALWRIYGHFGAVMFGIGFSLIPMVTALIGRGIRASQVIGRG